MPKLLSLLCLVLLTACADQNTDKAENVFQGHVDSLNKAKALEGTLLKADQLQRERINEQ